MIVALGLGCVVWTVAELVRLSQPAPALVGAPTRRAGSAFASSSSPSSAASSARRRAPLAAWDEQGRPIFVEDVSRTPR